MNRTIADLKMMQSLPLSIKVSMTKQRIRDWVSEYGVDGVSVSFSGGKDSTVLLHLVRSMYPSVEAVFVNTGLEYPEIQKFVKRFENVTILRPEMRFDEVIKKYGYPLISKEVAERVYNARQCIKSGGIRYVEHYYQIVKEIPIKAQQILGVTSEKFTKRYDFSKYKELLNVDFEISHLCCKTMKKKPLRKYAKKPFVATMACESFLRETAWLKTGCNAFNEGISKPMSFWTEQDVLEYIKQNDLPIAPVYGEVVYENNEQIGIEEITGENYGRRLCTTGCKRTGCIFCAFGAHLEKEGDKRFVRMKKTHPKQYAYCIGGGEYDADGIWRPNKDGLGMGHVFDELNKIYGDGFIEY